MKRRRICVITGSRAEYGLLRPLLRLLERDRHFRLQLLAAGAHLSPEFGLTYREIEADGFRIDRKVEMLLPGDTSLATAKSIGLGIMRLAEAFSRLAPELVILLGDRFEIFAAASAAHTMLIPIAHLHGGELSKGALDDAYRHAITKMSFLHFVSTEKYRRRVIQLGEAPGRVFNTGAIGLDNVASLQLLGRRELEQRLDFKLGARNALVTFHPVTLEDRTAGAQFSQLLKSLDRFPDLKVIFTKPNADPGGRVIIKLIDAYLRRRPGKAAAYTSLGTLNYLSAAGHCDAVAGNSSSGLIEIPSLGIPTVNIGDRQNGRLKPATVLDCAPCEADITAKLRRAFSPAFRAFCRKAKNPYGRGGTAEKIAAILRRRFPTRACLKKGFYDLPPCIKTGRS